MQYPLSIKSVYNFLLKAPAVLGAGYTNATVLGILDYTTAIQIEDVAPIHQQAYPSLGAGVPKAASDLIYVKLKTSTGEIRVIAMDWIASAPSLVTSTTALIKVNNIDLANLPDLRRVLLQNGFTQIEITTI